MKCTQYIDPLIKAELEKIGVYGFEFEFNDLNDFLDDRRIKFFTNDKNFESLAICRGEEMEVIVELKDGGTYKICTIDGDIPELAEWEPLNKENQS